LFSSFNIEFDYAGLKVRQGRGLEMGCSPTGCSIRANGRLCLVPACVDIGYYCGYKQAIGASGKGFMRHE
jgi:hypothetical protein